MLRFELGEDDSLFNNGIAKNIIITIEGKRMIIPVETTIADLCLKLKSVGVESPKEPIVPTMPQRTANSPILADSTIQRNDYVKYAGPADPDNTDLVVGAEYRVIDISQDTYDIKSDTVGFPIRLVVLKKDVVLSRKNTIVPVEPIIVLEHLANCGYCKTENVLLLDKGKDKFIGECVECHKVMEAERVRV